MSINGMASYGKTPRYVKLSSMPTPAQEQVLSYSSLGGGLNTSVEEYMLDSDESPDIVNLKWENGSVGVRPGQEWVDDNATRGQTYAAYAGSYHGAMFFHIGDAIWYRSEGELVRLFSLGSAYHGPTEEAVEQRTVVRAKPAPGAETGELVTSYTLFTANAVSVTGVKAKWTEGGVEGETSLSYTVIPNAGRLTLSISGLQENTHPTEGDSLEFTLAVAAMGRGGSFFVYGDVLYYKAPDVFLRITYNNGFTATDMTTLAYVPITYINMDAATHAGDAYQPENRLSARKTLWYNAAVTDALVRETTTTSTDYSLGAGVSKVSDVYLGNTLLTEGVEYVMDWTNSKICLRAVPEEGLTLSYTAGTASPHYYLPASGTELEVPGISAIMDSTLVYSALNGLKVNADPAAWSSAWDAYDYVYYPANGHILFKTSAYVSKPFVNNTVRVTYSLPNEAAWSSIMGCRYATVFGGNQNLCIVMAGSENQGNAYYWNGNGSTGMEAGYFPMNQYNFAGDTTERITGFGKQQYLLVIFKEHSIGRAAFGSTELDGRTTLTMNYTPINAEIGCDLPNTIQLIANNLVWCNTKSGVHYLKDSSSAYENNVICISNKVNRDLLLAVRGDAEALSFDDGKYYWLIAQSKAWLWYYAGTEQTDPSWFYYTGIGARAMAQDDDRVIYHADRYGRLSRFGSEHSDYGKAYLKRYTFPPSFLGSVDRYKDVTRAVFVLRNRAPGTVVVKYFTDYERREDTTPMSTDVWSLSPRDLSRRDLSVAPWERSFVRRPGCKSVRHLKLVLEAEEPDSDLSIVMVQVYYKYKGRLK